MRTNRNMLIQTLILFVCLVLNSTVATLRYDSGSSQKQWEKPVNETVMLQVYYESLCPGCVLEYQDLLPMVQKLGDQLDLRTYPYGNARMHKDASGQTIVTCQHGEAECYGNKLHACAIDQLHSPLDYLPYIACMMMRNSNDTAADECGKIHNVKSDLVKKCAKGTRGQDLLVYYGHESQKVDYSKYGVPFALVNGKTLGCENMWSAVCEAFKHPPDVCNEIPQKSSSEEAWEKPIKETVTLQVYYESLCPGCVIEYQQLLPMVQKLGDQLDVWTYPFGNGALHKDDKGQTIVICQHGEAECYGNKLHACAIDQLHSRLDYLPYIACMMMRNSNDTAADECGKIHNVNSNLVKKCAKGTRGRDLLLYYGHVSEKMNVSSHGVPFKVVNGKAMPLREEFSMWYAVCRAFKHPPDVCDEILQKNVNLTTPLMLKSIKGIPERK